MAAAVLAVSAPAVLFALKPEAPAGPAQAPPTPPPPSAALAPAAQEPSPKVLPATIPLFPLPDAVLFPNSARPLVVYEPRYREMVADAIKGDRIIGMILLQPGHEAEYEGRPPIHAIGCAGRISVVEQLPDGRYTLVLTGITRFRVLAEEPRGAYRVARVQPLAESRDTDPAALRADRERLEGLVESNQKTFAEFGAMLPPDQQTSVRKILDSARKALDSGSAAECTATLERIGEVSRILSDVILYDPGAFSSGEGGEEGKAAASDETAGTVEEA